MFYTEIMCGGAYSDLDRYVSPENYHNLGELYSETWGYSETKAQNESSAEFMVEQVKKYPGEITILCIGPTTNVVLVCLADDSFAENTAGIIYMGGSASGDRSFNWQYDADAVKVCLESAFPKQTVCTSETVANSNKKLWDVVIPAVFLCPELISKSKEVTISVSVEDESYGETEFTDDHVLREANHYIRVLR